MRMLVVEDNIEFYEDYMLRIFGNLLPMEEIEITHAANMEAALPELQKSWDLVFMDYSLGSPYKDGDGNIYRSGEDLVRYLRAREAGSSVQGVAIIIGTSSNRVGNDVLQKAGASYAFSKLRVEDMAERVLHELNRMKKQENHV